MYHRFVISTGHERIPRMSDLTLWMYMFAVNFLLTADIDSENSSLWKWPHSYLKSIPVQLSFSYFKSSSSWTHYITFGNNYTSMVFYQRGFTIQGEKFSTVHHGWILVFKNYTKFLVFQKFLFDKAIRKFSRTTSLSCRSQNLKLFFTLLRLLSTLRVSHTGFKVGPDQ